MTSRTKVLSSSTSCTKTSSTRSSRRTGEKPHVSSERSPKQKIENTEQNSTDALKKEKARWSRILRTYGITKEQYDELDKGHCPICTRNWSPAVRPCVDHDHVTGDVRGLLCIWCNRRAVGRFRDHELVQRIVDYLKEPRRGWVVPKKKPKKKKRKT